MCDRITSNYHFCCNTTIERHNSNSVSSNNLFICQMYIYTVKPEILAVIKFGGLGPKRRFSHYSGLKFGGMVRYRRTYIHAEKILADFNLAVQRHTAKPPNLIPRQIFRLYGSYVKKKLCFSASIFEKNRYIEKKNGLNKRKNRWKIGE